MNGYSLSDLRALGIVPAPALPTPRSPLPLPTVAPTAPTTPAAPPPPYLPPTGMQIAPDTTCMTVSQWLALNPDPNIALHSGEGDLRACIVSQAQQPSGQWLVSVRYTGVMYGPAGPGVGPGSPIDTVTSATRNAPWLIPIGWQPSSASSGISPMKVGLGIGALYLLSRLF